MNKSVWRHLLATYGKRPAVWVGIVTEIIRTFIMRFGIVLIMAQVTVSLTRSDLSLAKDYIFLLIAAMVFATIVGSLGELLAIKHENKEYAERVNHYYSKILSKDMAFYRDHKTGSLAAGFRQYLDGMMELTRFMRVNLNREIISLVVPVVILSYINWRVGLVAFAIVLVQLLYVLWSSKKIDPHRIKSHKIYRKLSGEFADQITNIVAFKSSGAEDKAFKYIAELSKQESLTFWKRRAIAIFYDMPRGVVTGIGMGLAFYVYVASLSSVTPEDIGKMVVIISYMFMIVRVSMEMPNVLFQYDDLISRVYPHLEYFDNTNETVTDASKHQTLKVAVSSSIVFKNVTFSYDNAPKKVLANFNLAIAAGERVGIVGLSGAGKSTLANLFLRFDEPQKGEILVDTINISGIDQSELRRSIAYVPQEPLLFHRTIRENIAYFNDNVSQKEIEKVAKIAHAHEFIKELPNGYDTLVGERGVKLSGGQKQRIAIARSLLKHTSIVLFDEATSALDSESEAIIQKALPEVIGKKTAIVIAHRLSTIAGLDRIVVMHGGKIVEQGTHAELIAQKGRYAKLWAQQAKELA